MGADRMINWAVASCPIPGEELSGDQYMVTQNSRALIAVVDGAGHGAEAILASEAAVSVLQENPNQSLSALFLLCHERLRSTRGAAMSLALFDPDRSEVMWAGVGNIEGVVLRKSGDAEYSKESLLLRSGIVGYKFSPPRVSSLPVSRNDFLIFATDGIRSDFLAQIDLREPVKNIAQDILTRHAKGTDDAMVLVAQFSDGAVR